MSTLPCRVTSHDLVKMARLPVAIPTQRRLNATEGFSLVNERLSQVLGQHERAWSDETLLVAYQQLRECTGLHPADLVGEVRCGRAQ